MKNITAWMITIPTILGAGYAFAEPAIKDAKATYIGNGNVSISATIKPSSPEKPVTLVTLANSENESEIIARRPNKTYPLPSDGKLVIPKVSTKDRKGFTLKAFAKNDGQSKAGIRLTPTQSPTKVPTQTAVPKATHTPTTSSQNEIYGEVKTTGLYVLSSASSESPSSTVLDEVVDFDASGDVLHGTLDAEVCKPFDKSRVSLILQGNLDSYKSDDSLAGQKVGTTKINTKDLSAMLKYGFQIGKDTFYIPNVGIGYVLSDKNITRNFVTNYNGTTSTLEFEKNVKANGLQVALGLDIENKDHVRKGRVEAKYSMPTAKDVTSRTTLSGTQYPANLSELEDKVWDFNGTLYLPKAEINAGARILSETEGSESSNQTWLKLGGVWYPATLFNQVNLGVTGGLNVLASGNTNDYPINGSEFNVGLVGRWYFGDNPNKPEQIQVISVPAQKSK